MVVKTMQQFLNNPTGEASAVFARRDIVIANLQSRFNNLMKEYAKQFKCVVNVINGNYVFYLKVPSESYPNKLLYDVVLEFIPIGSANRDLTINNYAVNVFSNAPNFIFTYAYVYNKDGNIVNFLKNKIGSKCLNEPPKTKNPSQSYGFEKSIYFALLYLKYLGYNAKINANKVLDKRVTKDFIYKKVMSGTDKLEEYNKMKENNEKKREYKALKTKGRVVLGNNKKKRIAPRKVF